MNFGRRRFLAAISATGLCGGRAKVPPAIGGDFTLVDGAGKIVTGQDFLGRFLLLFFGYTNCPDACPLALSKLAQCLRVLGPAAERVNAVFVTIDPARDTPARMGQYAALFSPRIRGLSGSAAQVARIVSDYHVYVGQADKTTGAIIHGTLFYVVGPDGYFVEALPDDLPAEVMAERLRRDGVR